ncbi:MAG: beta-lactamase family protein [Cytophagales bacterium]|nr:beta-lactamase family protein [Cytophagales bacterium]
MSKCTSLFVFLITWLALGQPLALLAQSPLKTKERIKQVETGLVPPIRFTGDSLWNLRERMKHYRVPGMSIAVIENFKIVWVKSYGVKDLESKEPVTGQTLFQAASISKPLSAYAALREVEKGKIALEEDINHYLTSWHLAENEFTKANKVTLKYLLSHRAGVTVQGFSGYATDEKVPTLLQVLNGEPPANSASVQVDQLPGSGFRYAGGGYCIVQQLLTDTQKKPFPAVMEALVLNPLGMTNSTFAQPLPESTLRLAASGYLPDGTAVPGKSHTYPELAASGLWTTAEDLARFVIDLELSLKGKSNKVLSRDLANQMLTPFGEAHTGLGMFLDPKEEDVYFQHAGRN